jgi:hypothetical protein
MATLWREDGSSAEVHPADGRGFSLEEMQAHAGTDGGPVEIVYLSRGTRVREGEALIIDDDGHARGKAANGTASALYRVAGGVWPIVGAALLARYEALGSEQERWW